MRRYFRYILLSLVLGICAGSCIEEMEVAQPELDKETLTTLVPRVTSFTNKYVTKADGENLETRISSLVVLVFNNDGAIVHIQQQTDANTSSVVLNKSMLDSPQQAGKLSTATVAMIANVAIDNIKDGNDKSIRNIENLSELDSYICSFTEAETVITAPLGSEFKGFPMFGQKTVNLTATKGSHAEEIPLKILYAKVNFEIAVKDGTENSKIIDGNTQFRLDSYSVYNTSTATKLGDITASDTATESDAYGYTSGKVVEMKTGNTATLNSSTVSFTLYVAENRYNHTGLSGIYPNGWLSANDDEDVKGYKDMDEAEKAKPENKLNGVKYFYDDYIQQYKPKLAESSHAATSGDLATYIKLTGTYTDYRGTLWDVNYNIYLGKDNAQNFHVDRNSEYTNKITIKGIRNNDSYTDTDEEGKLVDEHVWIDHRVAVSLGANQGADDCVTITRETLIDSHIEVRPLRVKWDENKKYTFARIHLPYYTEDNGKTWVQRNEATSDKKNWIGIERGDKTSSLYCKDEVSAGKRKYFTSSLISNLCTISGDTDIETHDDVNFILLNNDGCAWIYIDEYIYSEGTTTIADKPRMAKIIVDFCTVNGSNFSVNLKEEYILYQQPLMNISDGQYYIENYEEYLHSYDSHDKYNIETSPTDYTGQGLRWGYDNSKVSKSQFVTSNATDLGGIWESITNPNNGNPYDFLHSEDSKSLTGYTVRNNAQNVVDLSDNTGFNFTYNASELNSISISSMGEMPTSAYQYCLSKNKFTEAEEGEDHTMMVHWYVPDVYELSDIFGAENSPLSENNFYWSSQANYNISDEKTYIYEDTAHARAVSATGATEKSRKDQHRIRCVYDREGNEANMSSRTPEGIGGLIKIPMTVADNGFFNYNGWIEELELDGETTKPYEDIEYKFPKNDEFADGTPDRTNADKDFSGSVINGVHYYAKNPLTEWGDFSFNGTTYYSLIHEEKWPGLTEFMVKNVTDNQTLNNIASSLGISSLCTLTDTPKTDTKEVTTRKGKIIEQIPSNDKLATVPLDHNEDTKEAMTISFGNGKNTAKSPEYQYHKEDPTAALVQTYTRYWEVPEYSSTPFEGEKQPTFYAPAQAVTYTQNEVEDYIKKELDGLLTLYKRSVLLKCQCTPITTVSEYAYETTNAARNAASDYFNNIINVNNEYKDLEYGDISTSRQEIKLCSYTYTYQKQKRSIFKDWENNGDPIEATGDYIKTLYTYEITYQKHDGTYYKYVSGTGGWGEETGPETRTGAEAALETVDALTFYAGNSFTINTNITTDSNGKQYKHYIRSVKVNYNTSTISEGDTYLRFVAGADYLPSNNVEPVQMTYLDGDNGWSKWTSSGNDDSVTLRLVIYDKSDAGLLNWWNPPFSHTNPDTNAERNRNLIITSLEIRLETVPL